MSPKLKKSKNIPLKVYFDGTCLVCSTEIDHYRALLEMNKKSQLMQFVDITDSHFDAKKENLDPYLGHRELHVRTPDGKIHVAVDAFAEIWKYFPRYKPLEILATHEPTRTAFKMGYWAFARIRKYLPKRKKAGCDDSPYCELHKP